MHFGVAQRILDKLGRYLPDPQICQCTFLCCYVWGGSDRPEQDLDIRARAILIRSAMDVKRRGVRPSGMLSFGIKMCARNPAHLAMKRSTKGLKGLSKRPN